MKTALILVRRLSQLPLLLASVALFLLMSMTFADVILRSTFNAPIEAATELTRIFMALIVFLIMPIISGTQEHIVVDLADPLFTNKWAIRIRDTLVNLICGAMLFWPAKKVWELAERARDYGDVTEYLAIPQFYIGWFIAAMTILSAIVLLARGLITLFAPQLLEEQND